MSCPKVQIRKGIHLPPSRQSPLGPFSLHPEKSAITRNTNIKRNSSVNLPVDAIIITQIGRYFRCSRHEHLGRTDLPLVVPHLCEYVQAPTRRRRSSTRTRTACFTYCGYRKFYRRRQKGEDTGKEILPLFPSDLVHAHFNRTSKTSRRTMNKIYRKQGKGIYTLRLT